VRVPELPLLPGGKVDGRALLATLAARAEEGAAEASEANSDLLRFLQATWARILRIAPPALDADFFALGGDSLGLLELTLAVERHTGRPLSPAAFLKTPTIRGLADLIERQAATLPGKAPPRGARFDPRSSITLQRVRHAEGISQGSVVGMPSFLGHGAPGHMMAANALPDHEVWTFAADLDGRTMLADETWLACATEIADRLAAMTWLRPRALFGYSAGGYVAWLVDRILGSRTDWRPGRVIVVDAGPLHDQRPAARARVDDLIARKDARPGQMLLLHRRPLLPFWVQNDVPGRWRDLAVPFQAIGFRTLSHLDMNLPVTIRAARDAMAAFVETGEVPAVLRASDPFFNTPGGRLHRLLTAGMPPEPGILRTLAEQRGMAPDGDYRLALLLLLIAAGEPAPALQFARRMLGDEPGHRAATYATVGLLSLQGDGAAAANVAAAWCRERPHDEAIGERVKPAWRPGLTWRDLARLPIGSDASLDRALDMLAARHGVAAGWHA
jgi:acyl carrier protein